MSKHTPGPWRYREWGGLIVGGGAGSDEVLICTMATNTRHDEGRHNRALILAAPTMQARIAELEAERDELVRFKEDAILACAKHRCSKWEATLMDAEARAEAELAAARVDADEALDLLDLIFTAYDEGASCYEDPEDCTGYLGRAVDLSAADFNRCVALLARLKPRKAIDAARGES